jgi:quinol monooxygenase YgiN
MKPECTVIAQLQVKPERRADLLEMLNDIVILTRQETGCIEYRLHVSNDDPNRLVFYENWKTRQDMDDHMRMPYLENFLSRRLNFLTKEPDLVILTMVSDMN